MPLHMRVALAARDPQLDRDNSRLRYLQDSACETPRFLGSWKWEMCAGVGCRGHKERCSSDVLLYCGTDTIGIMPTAGHLIKAHQRVVQSGLSGLCTRARMAWLCNQQSQANDRHIDLILCLGTSARAMALKVAKLALFATLLHLPLESVWVLCDTDQVDVELSQVLLVRRLIRWQCSGRRFRKGFRHIAHNLALTPAACAAPHQSS